MKQHNLRLGGVSPTFKGYAPEEKNKVTTSLKFIFDPVTFIRLMEGKDVSQVQLC